MRLQKHQLRALTAGEPLPAPIRRKRDFPEFRIQSAFVRRWRAGCGYLGIAQCLGFHVNNGSVFGGGNAEWQRKERQIRGRLADLSGVESGVCDWLLLVPVMRQESYGGNVKWWHGLLLEFKRPGGVLSDEQEAFIGYATARGYRVEVHTDDAKAWAGLLEYLRP